MITLGIAIATILLVCLFCGGVIGVISSIALIEDIGTRVPVLVISVFCVLAAVVLTPIIGDGITAQRWVEKCESELVYTKDYCVIYYAVQTSDDDE